MIDPIRGVLHVIHGHGGGTEHHARSLIDASRGEFRHYLAIAVGERWQVEEHVEDGGMRSFEFERNRDETWPQFVGGICATFRIDLIHLHNLSGCRDGIIAALEAIGVPYGYTAHDLNFACPTILFLGVDGRYCFEQTDARVCGACLRAQPRHADVDIVAWRARHHALLARAKFVIAPSRWVASALERYFPGIAVDVISHGAPSVWAMALDGGAPVTRAGLALPDDDVPTVAVLGAVGPDKGARQLERMADLVRASQVRVRFVLIGYMDVQHGPWQSDDAVLTIHGRYDPRELPALLALYRVRLVAFPSAGPETFSFTLSEAWVAGLPVIVPPFGALAERVAGTSAGWVWSEAEWRDEEKMLARIATLVAPGNREALAAAARAARDIPQTTLADMMARTAVHYTGAAQRRGESPLAPFDQARIRDALGGVAWNPSVSVAQSVAAASASTEGAQATTTKTDGTVRFVRTLPSRLLHRLAPKRVREALKSRLR